jgi:hypothetical protein
MFVGKKRRNEITAQLELRHGNCCAIWINKKLYFLFVYHFAKAGREPLRTYRLFQRRTEF